MGETKLNWVLFTYNGNGTVARYIHQAHESAVKEFMDLGGNGSDPEDMHFAGVEDCQLVCIGSDPHFMLSELSRSKVAWWSEDGEKWASIRDLPCYVMNSAGVVVADHLRGEVEY